ncbi:hypothetical protein [Flavivirga eckloniae]|uniref:hypothetical protein n=1 Tax=Flavivirga eckloniae TaxID=1803846 RepID=UPI001315537C|nr:hypothetical protein [Flavivirga eckloniae]
MNTINLDGNNNLHYFISKSHISNEHNFQNIEIPLIKWYESFISKPYRKIEFRTYNDHNDYPTNPFWRNDYDVNNELWLLTDDDKYWEWEDSENKTFQEDEIVDNRTLKEVLIDEIYDKDYCCQRVTSIDFNEEQVIEVSVKNIWSFDVNRECSNIRDINLLVACRERIVFDIHKAMQGYSSRKIKSLLFSKNPRYSNLPTGLENLTQQIFSKVKKQFVEKGYLKNTDDTKLLIINNSYVKPNTPNNLGKLLFIHYNFGSGNVEISSNLIKATFLFIMESFNDVIYRYYSDLEDIETKYNDPLYRNDMFRYIVKNQEIDSIKKRYAEFLEGSFDDDYYSALKFIFGHELAHKLNVFDEEEADCLSYKILILGDPSDKCIFSNIIEESLNQGLENYWGYELSKKEDLIARAKRLNKIVSNQVNCP